MQMNLTKHMAAKVDKHITHTHICNSRPESHLDIFSFCHGLYFDGNECVSGCQFLRKNL